MKKTIATITVGPYENSYNSTLLVNVRDSGRVRSSSLLFISKLCSRSLITGHTRENRYLLSNNNPTLFHAIAFYGALLDRIIDKIIGELEQVPRISSIVIED